MIMFVLAVPSDFVHWFVFNWPDTAFGDFLCKISGGSWCLALALTVASLTAVSVERYCSLRWKIHAKRTAVILLLVWLFSLALTVPILVWGHVVRYTSTLSFCHVLPSLYDHVARGFFTAGFVLKYVIPLLVITCCYVGMATILARGTPASSAAVRARRRLAIAVLILNISFAICWLPHHAVILHFYYGDLYSTPFETFFILILISHVLSYVNSLVNPLVVFLISPAHRQPLVNFVRALCGKAPASTATDHYARFQDDATGCDETECENTQNNI